MKNLPTSFLFLCVCFVVACNTPHPQSEPAVSQLWFKGNLHTHSYWSDGDDFPEMIMDWYKSHGYHFVALSDHNLLAEGEKWVTIKDDSMYQQGFNKYLETHGKDWVVHEVNSGLIKVKLKTLEEYRKLFEQSGEFLIIQSEEITDKFEEKELHMNATNIQKKITPQGGNSVSEVLQNNIDQVLKQREETGVPMIPHINHPNFHYSISLEDMISLEGERFFEVYNGHPQVHNLGDAQHISTEEMWDFINISYLQQGKPMMYGIATDDAHHYHVLNKEWSNAGRGWIMVKADSLTAAALISALEAGSFYASTGISLKDIAFDQGKLSIEVEKETNVSYKIEFIGAKKGQSKAEILTSVEGGKARFTLPEDILFVRGKVTSSKKQTNPVEGMLYEMAWTQPVRLAD